MNETAILWIFGAVLTVLIPILAGLFLLITSHTRDCKALNQVLIRLDTNMTRLMSDIGDAEHGIRGQLNRHESMLGEHKFRIEALDNIWKAFSRGAARTHESE